MFIRLPCQHPNKPRTPRHAPARARVASYAGRAITEGVGVATVTNTSQPLRRLRAEHLQCLLKALRRKKHRPERSRKGSPPNSEQTQRGDGVQSQEPQPRPLGLKPDIRRASTPCECVCRATKTAVILISNKVPGTGNVQTAAASHGPPSEPQVQSEDAAGEPQ